MDQDTRKSFHTQIQDMEKDILNMGNAVEEALNRSVRSLQERDIELAEKVVAEDEAINDMELDIEQKCLNLLALQQPMAIDLRTISTALKLITDLERIGDHAKDIARVTIRLEDKPLIKPLIDIPRMAETARLMIREALTAFVERDEQRAYELVEKDHEVDHLYSQIFRELFTYMIQDPSTIHGGTQLMFAASHLERVADHATNLAEWVIFVVTGQRKELND